MIDMRPCKTHYKAYDKGEDWCHDCGQPTYWADNQLVEFESEWVDTFREMLKFCVKNKYKDASYWMDGGYMYGGIALDAPTYVRFKKMVRWARKAGFKFPKHEDD